MASDTLPRKIYKRKPLELCQSNFPGQNMGVNDAKEIACCAGLAEQQAKTGSGRDRIKHTLRWSAAHERPPQEVALHRIIHRLEAIVLAEFAWQSDPPY